MKLKYSSSEKNKKKTYTTTSTKKESVQAYYITIFVFYIICNTPRYGLKKKKNKKTNMGNISTETYYIYIYKENTNNPVN